MASVLDLVKHYQHAIEKYSNDQQRVLKSIDKLFNLDVTVQHLQDTGVGRTVNALRKEPGSVGQAARALVCKWKLMVAAEESDQEGDHPTDSKTYNGHDNGRDSDDSAKKQPRSKDYQHETSDSRVKTEYKQENGHHSGTKRKYHSSEEEEPEVKKSKSSSSDNSYQQISNTQIKKEQTESESDYSDRSHSRDSDSESSEISEEEQNKKMKLKIKQEPPDNHKSKHSSLDKNHGDHKKESSRSKSNSESDKHAKNRHKSESSEKISSDKSSSKDKSHSSHKHKSSKEIESSIEKSHKSDHRSSEKSKQKEESSSSKHKDSSDKHKSSKSDSNSEKHNSNNTEKHPNKSDKGKSSSHSHKSDKDKNKSSSGKETSVEKHKSKESDGGSSKEKHSSSSKERSKDGSSSSKEKSEHSHKSDKKHSSSDKKSKHSENKHKSERKIEETDDMKTKHKSSSSSSHASKSRTSKSKEDIPKKKSNDNGGDSDEGINCESGASFAEALGMISPTKPKKKTKVPLKDVVSPNLSNIEDLSPAALLAPSAKLAPLPAIEISALPEISPNYKPLPPPKLLPHFTEDEALSASISSKNQRTKVYSGNKVIGGKIPTLYEMCVQVLQEHIDALEYTGGVPYDILKPVVDRATPQQLFMLEHFNPYLMEDTDHLWHKFCEKHFRNKQRQEMETWREMYMRCQEEQEHRLKSLTANIRIAQEKAKAPIKQTKMAYVDTVVKPPRNIARKQALHGTAHAAAASPAARVASLAAAPNVLRGSARPSPAAPAIFAPHRPKKAPLMQKALQFMRGRKR